MTQEEFSEKLEELWVRFNTSPKVYLKEDFLILYQILEELYDLHDTRIIELKSEWEEVVRRNTLPDGNLIKTTIEAILNRISIVEEVILSIDLSKIAKLGDNENATLSDTLAAAEDAKTDANSIAKFFDLPAALPSDSEFITPAEVITELERIVEVIDPSVTLPTYVDMPETYQGQEGVRRYYDDGTDEFIPNN